MSFGWVIYTLVVLAVGMLIGAFAQEHANRPELTQDELFDAMDRIVKVCEGDHDKVRVMLDELYGWMRSTEDLMTVSKELNEIIEGVRIKKENNHGKY